MDRFFPFVFYAIFVIVIGNFLYGRVKYGSWTGAMLKGNIEKTHGEVDLSTGRLGSQVMKVVTLRENDGERFIGLVVTAKSPMSASMMPFRLSRDQARNLAEFLAEAAK
jgi:hypothetical protein